MAQEKRRSRFPWKLLPYTFGILTFLAGLHAVSCGWMGERGWASMEARIAELIREEHARPTARPVLRGNALPGNAWDDYGRALSLLATVGSTPGWSALMDYPQKPSLDPAPVRAFLEKHEAALHAFRLGVRRERSDYPLLSPDGKSLNVVKSSLFLTLHRIARCQSRRLAEDGNAHEAMELLLDLAQFGRDLTSGSTEVDRSIGQSILGGSLEELRDLVQSGRISPNECLQISRELEIVDGSLRDIGYSEEADLIALGLEFTTSRSLFFDLRQPKCMCGNEACPPWGAWRYGFSDRLMAARAFETAMACAKDAAAFRSAPWNEAKPARERLQDRLYASPNPIVRSHVVRLTGLDTSARRVRAHLRLLRVGCRHLAAGEILDLTDPFGGRLLAQRHETGLRVWSVGPDGIDDGGVGRWTPMGAQDKDIVLDIPR